MFGYIKIYAPELYVRENEFYRGLYCGLCRSLGKCTGQLSRLTLNYDFVFGALLRIAATGENIEFKPRRCIVHPLFKKPMANRGESLDFCARAAVILSYEKLGDDLSDERGKKKAGARFLRVLMKGMNRRAKRALKSAHETVTINLSRLSELEAQGTASADLPADIFGELMGELISIGIDGPNGRILKNAAYHLGRWIYLLDAADDLEEDCEKGRFNPFYLVYGKSELSDSQKETVFCALTAELMAMEDALALLPRDSVQKEVFGIIDNILHLGMPRAADRVLYSEKGREMSDE